MTLEESLSKTVQENKLREVTLMRKGLQKSRVTLQAFSRPINLQTNATNLIAASKVTRSRLLPTLLYYTNHSPAIKMVPHP